MRLPLNFHRICWRVHKIRTKLVQLPSFSLQSNHAIMVPAQDVSDESPASSYSIAMFSEYLCDQVIAACSQVLANHNKKEVA